MKPQILKRLLRESHTRQFNGEDWQAVAADLTPDDIPEAERDEVFDELSSSPDPGCECGFCATAEWHD